MFRKVLLTISIFLSVSICFSQEIEEKTVNIGDEIVFGKCTLKDHYKYIDKYKKTRVVDTSKYYDTSTGEGFYSFFFTSGDFDPSKLSAKYKGKKFKIISLEVFKDKATSVERRVIFVQLEEKNAIAWVEFDKAVESGELIIP